MMNLSRREVFSSYNSLVCLAQGVIGERTIVDLRNECSITGKVDQVDGNMNICMSDVVFTNQRGDEFYYELFFLKERNIRYIHIPSNKSIKETIERGLHLLNARNRQDLPKKRTFKEKRAKEMQRETLALIEKIKEERLKQESD